jgi:hypothetical protein
VYRLLKISERFAGIAACFSLVYCLSYLSVLKIEVIQSWSAASTSNLETLERFQSKVLRMIVAAPRYVPNTVIRRDLQTPTVKEEIRHYSSQYSARLSVHPNDPAVNLIRQSDYRRLRRHMLNDLSTKFLV